MAEESAEESQQTIVPEIFDFSNFTPKLEAFLQSEANFVDGSLVVSLNGQFGSGKTTFLDLWEKRIEDAEQDCFKPKLIRVNVWEEDYANDPFASLVFSIVDGLGRRKKRLAAAASRVLWLAAAGASQLTSKLTGIDAWAMSSAAVEKAKEREESDPHQGKLWELFHKRKEALKKLKAELRKSVRSAKGGVLILVDELDRCRPDYAIAYLETIKHVFDIPGLTFDMDRAHG